MKKKRAVTLIEVMIVMMLIGLIGGALAFNMRGSMDQGRVFKTEQNQMRIHDILMLEIAKGESAQNVAKNWETRVLSSPLAGQGKEILNDGWKKKFTVTAEGDEDIKVQSVKLEQYRAKHAQA